MPDHFAWAAIVCLACAVACAAQPDASVYQQAQMVFDYSNSTTEVFKRNLSHFNNSLAEIPICKTKDSTADGVCADLLSSMKSKQRTNCDHPYTVEAVGEKDFYTTDKCVCQDADGVEFLLCKGDGTDDDDANCQIFDDVSESATCVISLMLTNPNDASYKVVKGASTTTGTTTTSTTGGSTTTTTGEPTTTTTSTTTETQTTTTTKTHTTTTSITATSSTAPTPAPSDAGRHRRQLLFSHGGDDHDGEHELYFNVQFSPVGEFIQDCLVSGSASGSDTKCKSIYLSLEAINEQQDQAGQPNTLPSEYFDFFDTNNDKFLDKDEIMDWNRGYPFINHFYSKTGVFLGFLDQDGNQLINPDDRDGDNGTLSQGEMMHASIPDQFSIDVNHASYCQDTDDDVAIPNTEYDCTSTFPVAVTEDLMKVWINTTEVQKYISDNNLWTPVNDGGGANDVGPKHIATITFKNMYDCSQDCLTAILTSKTDNNNVCAVGVTRSDFNCSVDCTNNAYAWCAARREFSVDVEVSDLSGATQTPTGQQYLNSVTYDGVQMNLENFETSILGVSTHVVPTTQARLRRNDRSRRADGVSLTLATPTVYLPNWFNEIADTATSGLNMAQLGHVMAMLNFQSNQTIKEEKDSVASTSFPSTLTHSNPNRYKHSAGCSTSAVSTKCTLDDEKTEGTCNCGKHLSYVVVPRDITQIPANYYQKCCHTTFEMHYDVQKIGNAALLSTSNENKQVVIRIQPNQGSVMFEEGDETSVRIVAASVDNTEPPYDPAWANNSPFKHISVSAYDCPLSCDPLLLPGSTCNAACAMLCQNDKYGAHCKHQSFYLNDDAACSNKDFTFEESTYKLPAFNPGVQVYETISATKIGTVRDWRRHPTYNTYILEMLEKSKSANDDNDVVLVQYGSEYKMYSTLGNIPDVLRPALQNQMNTKVSSIATRLTTELTAVRQVFALNNDVSDPKQGDIVGYTIDSGEMQYTRVDYIGTVRNQSGKCVDDIYMKENDLKYIAFNPQIVLGKNQKVDDQLHKILNTAATTTAPATAATTTTHGSAHVVQAANDSTDWKPGYSVAIVSVSTLAAAGGIFGLYSYIQKTHAYVNVNRPDSDSRAWLL